MSTEVHTNPLISQRVSLTEMNFHKFKRSIYKPAHRYQLMRLIPMYLPLLFDDVSLSIIVHVLPVLSSSWVKLWVNCRLVGT